MKAIFISAVALAAGIPLFPAHADDTGTAGVELTGCVTYSGNTTARPLGVYTFGSDGEFTQRIKGFNATGGAVMTPGLYWGVMYSNPAPTVHQVTLLKFNPDTWGRSSGGSATVPSLVATDMAYDPTTDNIYGCFYNDDKTGYVFGFADYGLKKRFAVCDLEEAWVSVAADAAGRIYAFDKGGVLYSVDKFTGAATRIGATGIAPYYDCSATIDISTGKCWWAVSTETRKSSLYEVNLDTGLATKAFDFPNNEVVRGLGVKSKWNADGAPAAPSVPNAVFAQGALSGTVAFTLPAQTADGAALSGELDWKILANGRQAAAGKAEAGSRVEAPVTLAADGDTKITVFAANAEGMSPASSTSISAGFGTPKRPEPSLAYSDGTLTVSWPAVTAAVAGGYFNAADVTYSVRRMSDGTVVAANLTGLSYSENVEDTDRLVKHRYAVTASFQGKDSPEGTTGSVVTGSKVKPAWSDNFDNNDMLAHFTIVDVNGDGKSWARTSSTSGRIGCVQSQNGPMDDWLISPPLALAQGCSYKVTVTASAGYGSERPERFEVKWGREASPTAMTSCLIEPTVLDFSQPAPFEAYLHADEAGDYFVGIHGISDPTSFRLDVDCIEIGAAVSENAPASPEITGIMPDASGEPKVEITFRTPSKSLKGENLASLDEVRVLRDGELIKSFTAPAPGTQLTVGDETPSAAAHTYSFTASNGAGFGIPLEQKVFVGINVAAAPSNARISETGTPGELTLTWEAPKADKDGNPINPALITYRVVRLQSGGNTEIARNLTDTSLTFTANPKPEEQTFAAYGVYAVTKGGESEGCGSNTLSVGIPYAAPYRDSFANGEPAHSLGIKTLVGQAAWRLGTNATFDGISPLDGDNGLILMQGVNLLDSAMFYTGKIDLSATEHPAITFHTYVIGDSSDDDARDVNTITLLAKTPEAEEWTEIAHFPVYEAAAGGAEGWYRIVADLSAFAGKTVQTAVAGCVRKYAFIMVDNLRIGNLPQRNLAVNAVAAPAESAPGSPFAVTVEVENAGRGASASTAEITLSRNGIEMERKNVPALEPGAKSSVAFTDSLGIMSDLENLYTASLTWDADGDDSDNRCVSPTLRLIHNPYPNPSGLGAVETAEGVELQWNVPDNLSTLAVTENFESYPSYANSGLGEWTLVDGDGGNIGGIQGIQIPGIDQGSQQSWWVMDSDLREGNRFFAAHSGKKYLAQMFVSKGGGAVACDDWLISPELSGAAQTVTLFAKTYNSKYPESFKIMYSTGGTDTADFTEAASFEEIPDEWLPYSADLPAGAKYFAVRAVSYDCMMLFVDDVTYQPAAGSDLEFVGYNVYRNKEKVNGTPVAAESFTDDAPKGNHGWHVTAVYTQGESRPSGEVRLEVTSVEVTAGGKTVIAPVEGGVQVSGATGEVTVHTADGKTVCTRKADGCLFIPLQQGLYIVKAGATATKVNVE